MPFMGHRAWCDTCGEEMSFSSHVPENMIRESIRNYGWIIKSNGTLLCPYCHSDFERPMFQHKITAPEFSRPSFKYMIANRDGDYYDHTADAFVSEIREGTVWNSEATAVQFNSHVGGTVKTVNVNAYEYRKNR